MLYFDKSISLSDDQEKQVRESLEFWSLRGFKMTFASENVWIGHRGNLWGNLMSFDNSHLETTLILTRTRSNTLTVVQEVDTKFQIITDYNKIYWHLELATWESKILFDDARENDWTIYRDQSSKADLVWVATLGLVTKEVTDPVNAPKTHLLRPAGNNAEVEGNNQKAPPE